MAATSLWRVTSGLGRVVQYAKNPQKTWLANVIDYAVQSRKTGCHDEQAAIVKQFVTGVNCQSETARDEMAATKVKFGKPGGTVAYHGYQSFAPGECTPEMAHEIGVKLAEKLWGKRYEVVVATHLDKAHHLHNHFVLNTVSFVDGIKFYRSNQDYRDMRRESDNLCREYSLSVIEKPREKAKQYGEWQAERDGRQTWRGVVKADVDAAIRQSMTERQFFDNLRKMGYQFKIGKDISVKPPGKERFVRLCRNFGDGYAIEGIRRRILAQTRTARSVAPRTPTPKRCRYQGDAYHLHAVRKMTGFRALYFFYLYKMGVLPRKRQRRPSARRVYFLFREDIRHLRNITQEIRLLAAHGIDTAEQLDAYKNGAAAQMAALCGRRARLRNEARHVRYHGGVVEGVEIGGGADALAAVKAEISGLTKQIAALRREVGLCDDITRRSIEMKDKLHRAAIGEKDRNGAEKRRDKVDKSKGKGLMNHEFRRRG